MRLLAASFFVSAAFAWPTWFLDRAGLAALGFAFLALSVGRDRGRLRPTTTTGDMGWLASVGAELPVEMNDLPARLAPYLNQPTTDIAGVPGRPATDDPE